MELHTILGFLLASLALTLMPGPDNIYVLTESMSRSSKRGIALSLGLASGVLVHTTLVATGLVIFLQKSVWAFDIIRYLGAAYLFYLAVGVWREKPVSISVSEAKDPKKFGASVRKGLLMNVLNPKVSLFFLALLPQFVNENGWSHSAQLYFLGGLFMVQAFLVFSLIALLAGRFNQFFQQERFWKYTQWCKFLVLVILSMSLFLF